MNNNKKKNSFGKQLINILIKITCYLLNTRSLFNKTSLFFLFFLQLVQSPTLFYLIFPCKLILLYRPLATICERSSENFHDHIEIKKKRKHEKYEDKFK